MIKITSTADKKYSYMNILLLGESGAGKTHFLGTADNEKTLVINVISESGIYTLKNKNIDATEVNSYEEFLDVIKYLLKNNHKYEYVAVDSLSQLQKNFENQSRITDKFKMWADIKEKSKDIVDKLKLLPMHTCCTSEVALIEDEQTGSFKIVPSLAGSAKNDITYWFDHVLYFDRFQQKDGMPIVYRAITQSASKFPAKSRGQKLPMIMENPTWKGVCEIEMLHKVDEEQRKIDLEAAKKEIIGEPISAEEIGDLNDLINTKEFDTEAFYRKYKSVADMRKPQFQEAVSILRLKPNKK